MGKVILKSIDHESIALGFLERLKKGEDVEVDSLNVLDELIFSDEIPENIRFYREDGYELGLKTIRDMRAAGYNVL